MGHYPPHVPFFGLGLFARAFDNSLDAVEISDIEGWVVYVNDAWCDLFEMEKTEAVGSIATALRGAEPGYEELKDSWERCIRAGNWRGVHRLIRSGGDQVQVSYSRTLYRNADGDPTAVITIYRPLSDL